MRIFYLIAVAGLCICASLRAQSNLEVSGLGFFKDRGLDARLSFLHDVEPDAEVELDAALLEDSAFLLLEQMKRKGYLEPAVEGRFQVGEEEERRLARWEGEYEIQLDVDFEADYAEFVITPGVLSFYDSVAVSGVDAMDSEKVERFFIPGGTLFSGKQARVFTYENLDRRVGRLLSSLDDLGYRSARIMDRQVKADAVSGDVEVKLEIEQGRLYKVGDVDVLIARGDGTEELRTMSPEDERLTPAWEQAQRATLRNEAYRAGYPDARVTSDVVSDVNAADGVMRRNLRFRVEYGPEVELAEINFRDDPKTKRSVLRQQIDLKPGQPLDLIEVNKAQRKLMGLGIFQQVGLSFEPAEGQSRSVVYELTPSQRKELQLRGGWGSYEQARLGFRWEHRNPWGRAHRYEIEAKKSVKATRGDTTYSLPQVFGTDLTAYLNAEYSYREELSFDRTAQGVGLGTSLQMAESGLRLAVEYRFSKETADRDNAVNFRSEENATVASVVFRASLDRRNDFLAPTSGYSLFASFKTASRSLGGNVDFQKIELGGTYHASISESIIFHAGLRGGTIFTSGDEATNIPFNERYFLGGENSVRGYLEGGAAPLAANGDEVGAESYVLLNLELEQRIFSQFSIVAFVDAVTNFQNGFSGGGSEMLYSVGMGLRYKSAVGPLRLEYGHNPDPRKDDPGGTFHFSIGFPF